MTPSRISDARVVAYKSGNPGQRPPSADSTNNAACAVSGCEGGKGTDGFSGVEGVEGDRQKRPPAPSHPYDLQNLKRATIVGEVTGGGAHPGGGERLSEHFIMFVPSGRAINPVTKTDWEGTGVKPDVEVPAEKALKTANLLALKKAAQKAADPGVKRRLDGLIADLENEVHP